MRTLVLLAIASLLTACRCPGPTPQPSPKDAPAGNVDAATGILEAGADAADPFQQACSNLQRLGCPEGVASDCAAVLSRMVQANLTTMSVPCLAAASDGAGVRACGGVGCAGK